ncbi:MAG: hypothetical protein DRJ52_08780 [Thermoprotei archaeon]|nr:MAG: hypothetical protein DRJ52_08780 [Thermoprotei archaeon]RLE99626.1 MAG: hypothetical protein DRJ63_04875 [Thermoprotei archaeon]
MDLIKAFEAGRFLQAAYIACLDNKNVYTIVENLKGLMETLDPDEFSDVRKHISDWIEFLNKYYKMYESIKDPEDRNALIEDIKDWVKIIKDRLLR